MTVKRSGAASAGLMGSNLARSGLSGSGFMAWVARSWHGWPRLLAATILVMVTACGAARDGSPGAAAAAETNGPLSARFFTVVYEQIADKYVQPITVSRVALTGLQGLARVDSRFDVRRQGDRVELRDGNQTVATFPVPARDDARGWADTTMLLVEAARQRSDTVRDATSEAIYQAVMDSALTQLDQYSRYANQEQAREGRATRDGFGGIGITLDTENNIVRVRNVQPESPAERAGVKADDRITQINGEAVTGLTSRDVVQRLRGEIGSSVGIQVDRPSSRESLQFTLVRQLIVPMTVSYRREGNIAYIRLLGFNQRTTDVMADAVRQARREIGAGMQGIILDMRGNLGGLLDQSISVSDMFLPSGEIVSTRGRHRQSGQVSFARGRGLAVDVPLVVLVNGSSASASEIVAAALQDNGRAIVVGTTSFGKGSVQTVVPLPNDGELFLTWARFHAPSGYPLQDLGVLPLVCTSGGRRTPDQVIADVRAGRLTTTAAMASWRHADHENPAQLRRLRNTCPPETNERDSDVEIARRLLGEQQLFARALRSARAVAQAR
jgi:carboxyl-terminal processing protease